MNVNDVSKADATKYMEFIEKKYEGCNFNLGEILYYEALEDLFPGMVSEESETYENYLEISNEDVNNNER